MKTEIYYTDNQYETELCGKNFAEKLVGKEIIALDGDLGSGKTVFVKGMAKGLGIEDAVTSPTYTIVHEYAGHFPLYHFDVYRINVDDLEDIGFYDYLGKGVCVIEWAVIIKDVLPGYCIGIKIERLAENKRKVIITMPDEVSEC